MIDATELKNKLDIGEVIGRYLPLQKNGVEFKALCPFHDEKTASFTVTPAKQFFYCYGCGAGGDVIDFVVDYERVSFPKAVDILTGGQPISQVTKTERKSIKVDYYDRYSPDPYHGGIPVAGEPISYINPKRDHKTSTVKPSHVWPYYDAQGAVNSIVIRFDIDGKKITPTLRWCSGQWVMYPMADKNRPLYNLTEVMKNQKQVFVVEGEKAAQYLQSAVGNLLTVTAWSGGTNRVDASDWSALRGRHVVLIPDADEEGHKAMSKVFEILTQIGVASIKTIFPEDDRPKGWDVADVAWDSADQFVQWCKSRQADEQPVEPNHDDDENDGGDYYSEDYEKTQSQSSYKMPYQLLGYNGDHFFFLPESSKQVKSLTATGMSSPSNMLSIAPLDHWCEFAGLSPDDKMKAEHWQMHVNSIIQHSYEKGIFDSAKIRGRGAWIDDGRNILHLGSVVYVDGVAIQPEQVPSKYIYPKDLDMAIEVVTPLSNREAHKLYDICGRLSWEKELSGALLAGWCVIAPLCGILNWRPHIWVTGPAGSGKSTVTDNIIKVMCGDIGVRVDGKTSEAGIRQLLGDDARPVIFDEAEAEDEASAKRMQGILDFARVSSSGGKIVKGSAAGKSMEFIARSAFCFSSINTSVKHFADESRITKLVIQKDDSISGDVWDKLRVDLMETITPEYANAMIARSIHHLDAIKKNIEVFVKAASLVFKSQRIADQVGTLLAGVYFCHSTGVISLSDAKAWIEKSDWQEHTTLSVKSDSERLIERISSNRVHVAVGMDKHDITIGEAIVIASRIDINNPLDSISDACGDELRRRGVMVTPDGVSIANNCTAMVGMLRGTPWESSWSRVLLEIKGSAKTNYQYYSPGIKSRGVILPISTFSE